MCDVLVLEDDFLTREAVSDALAEGGFAVRSADCAAEAFALLREDAPRVLVADMTLRHGQQEENGHALAEQAMRLCPSLAVVYISGEQDALEARRLTPRERILPKPFVADELVGLVRDMLLE